jgi:hypothetical protein
MKATVESWQHIPFTTGTPIPYQRSFTERELSRLVDGLIPEAMEDKWFVYVELPSLFFHRSWTGRPIYRVDLVRDGDIARVAEALVSTDVAGDADEHAATLSFLIANLLLGESQPFPMPARVDEANKRVYQHRIAGTGFPDVPINRR